VIYSHCHEYQFMEQHQLINRVSVALPVISVFWQKEEEGTFQPSGRMQCSHCAS
jgi:hypothetical protein